MGIIEDMPNPSSIFCSQILWYLGSRTKIISWQFSQNHDLIEIVYWEILPNWYQDYFLVWKFKTVYCYALILIKNLNKTLDLVQLGRHFFSLPWSKFHLPICFMYCIWHFVSFLMQFLDISAAAAATKQFICEYCLML